jgi:pimeloyl-ACP methyl ester carboxylesterase
MPITERRVSARGLEFGILEAGEGPLAICLHGFPDQARSYSSLLERLAAAGFHGVAPYMRGYHPTQKAPDGCYQGWATGSDAAALIPALGYDKAMVIGHDWGAVAAYATANLAPERVEKLVTMAVPYGPGVMQAFVADGDQQRRSWYMFFFQTAFAEMAVSLNDFAFIDRLWAEWSPGYELPPAQRRALKDMFAQPGVLTEALAYYRQVFGTAPLPAEWAEQQARTGGPIAAPTLYLHGINDGCMAASLSDGMEGMFTGGYQRVLVPNAGHFLHLEQPKAVEDAILAFLQA